MNYIKSQKVLRVFGPPNCAKFRFFIDWEFTTLQLRSGHHEISNQLRENTKILRRSENWLKPAFQKIGN